MTLDQCASPRERVAVVVSRRPRLQRDAARRLGGNFGLQAATARITKCLRVLLYSLRMTALESASACRFLGGGHTELAVAS